MRHVKQFLIVLSSALFLIATIFIAEASAQIRRNVRVSSGYSYPIVTRRIYRRPFFYSRFYDPFYDPYDYDPYLRLQRDKYYREKAVRDARREIAIHREKYYADGVITEKERKQMIDDQYDYQKAVSKLRSFNGRYYD